MLYIIITVISTILLIFYLFIYLIDKKLIKLENIIKKMLKERTDLIPALYEISKEKIVKVDDVYKEAITLRKNELMMNDLSTFIEFLRNERLIHHEMNFIYGICLKNKKLEKNWKFIYIKEITINKSYEISKKVEMYKKIVKKLNFLIKIKNITIIGMFFPGTKRFEI